MIAELAIAQSSGYSNVSNGESSKAKKTETSKSNPQKLNDSLKQIELTVEIDALRKQLKAQSDANQAQIDQLKADLEKAKNTETAREDARKFNDSVLLFNLSGSDVKLTQLKAKSESNQSQIDQLKVDNARTKIAGTVNRPVDNTLVIGQLKAQSDSNQVQIDRLRAELAKAKETEATIAQLKAKSESNQSQIDQLKVDNARTKIAGTVNRPVDNTLAIGQLKARSDSNQVQIDQLRAELAKAKETEAVIAQLKAKSESNQSQIDQLKVDNARTKIAGTVNRPIDNTLVIGQLKAQSDTNQTQIGQLKRELAKDKETEAAMEVSRRSKDSVLRHFLISETDALLTQLKTKSDTNQVQFERLKAELENTKASKKIPESNKENDAVIAQLKAKSDANQAQIDQLKEELAKAKEAERARKSSDSLALVNSQGSDVKLAMLKAKSESNQAQIDQLKVDNARTKIAGTITSPATDNTVVIGQLKLKSDTNQAQIDRLKMELVKLKNAEVKTPSNTEQDSLIAELKIRSDNNQAQIDLLVEAILKSKEESAKSTNSVNAKKEVPVDKEVLGIQSIEKPNSNVEIDKVDPELEKTKKSQPSQMVPVVSPSGLPSSKRDGYVDEKGEFAGNGFYIVIGTFGSKENAERFKAATILKGHRNTKIMQNKITKMYNIFALKTNNKKDADLERAKYKGEYSNVWILNLE